MQNGVKMVSVVETDMDSYSANQVVSKNIDSPPRQRVLYYYGGLFFF